MTRLQAPRGGTPPPDAAVLPDGASVFLAPLAHETCRRYRAEFPDEEERYGAAGMAWCVHDTQYLLAWAFQEAELRAGDFDRNLAWLARALEARAFPLDRLARDLELAAEVVEESAPAAAQPAVEVLRAGARALR